MNPLSERNDLLTKAPTATEALRGALPDKAEPQPASPVADAPPLPDATVFDGPARIIEVEDADQWIRSRFTHQGRAIDYRMFVPPGSAGRPGASPPLVLMLHGCAQGAADFAAGTRMSEHARESAAIVLYPEQTQRAHEHKCWNWFKTQHQQRDRGEPALLAALTRHVVQQQHADPRRVYVAGLSAGGAMADVLGNCYPDIYAAVGVHSGLAHGAAHDLASALDAMQTGVPAIHVGVKTMRPPVIVFHGDADAVVHPDNGLAVLAGATPGEASEGRSSAGQAFTRTLYAASAYRGDAEHWRLHAAGHAWSGGSAQGSFTQPDGVDASGEMIRFFLAHQLEEQS